MDKFDSLNDIADHVFSVASDRGWHPDGRAFEPEQIDDYVPKAVANLHGEVSEIWEAFRANRLDQPCGKPVDLNCLEEELADVIIRALDAASKLSIDIGRAVRLKSSFNATRPPRHGGKKA